MRRNSRNGEMVERLNGRMAEWWNGVIVERLILAEWRDGRNRYLPTAFMVHADDNTNTDTFYSFIVYKPIGPSALILVMKDFSFVVLL